MICLRCACEHAGPHSILAGQRGLSAERHLSNHIQKHAQAQLAIKVTDLCDVLEQLSYAVAALPPCTHAEVAARQGNAHPACLAQPEL